MDCDCFGTITDGSDGVCTSAVRVVCNFKLSDTVFGGEVVERDAIDDDRSTTECASVFVDRIGEIAEILVHEGFSLLSETLFCIEGSQADVSVLTNDVVAIAGALDCLFSVE